MPKNKWQNKAAINAPTKGAIPGTNSPYCQSLLAFFNW